MDAGGEYRPPSDCSATAANLPVQPLTSQHQDKQEFEEPQQQQTGLVGASTKDACMPTSYCAPPPGIQPMVPQQPSQSNGGVSPEIGLQASDLRGSVPSCSTGDVFHGSMQTKYPCIAGPCSSNNTSPIVHPMHGSNSMPMVQTLTSRHSAPPHILQCPSHHGSNSGMPYPGACMPDLPSPYYPTGWQEHMPVMHGAAGAGWPHVRCMPHHMGYAPEHPAAYGGGPRMGQHSPAMAPGMIPMEGIHARRVRRVSGHHNKAYGPMPLPYSPNIHSNGTANGMPRRSTLGGLQPCSSAPLAWSYHNGAGCSHAGSTGFSAAGSYSHQHISEGMLVAREFWDLYQKDSRPVPLPKIIVADITKDLHEDLLALQAFRRNGSMGAAASHVPAPVAARQDLQPMKDHNGVQPVCRRGSPVPCPMPTGGMQQPVVACTPAPPTSHGTASVHLGAQPECPSTGVQDAPALPPACRHASASEGLLSHPVSPQAAASPCTTANVPEVPPAQPVQPLPALPPRHPQGPHSTSPNLIPGAVAIVRQSPGEAKRKRDSRVSDTPQGMLSLSGRLSEGQVMDGIRGPVCEMPAPLRGIVSDLPIRVTDVSVVSARTMPADDLECLYGDWANGGVADELVFDHAPEPFYTPFGKPRLELLPAAMQPMPGAHALAMVSTGSARDMVEDVHHGKKAKTDSCTHVGA